MKEVVYTIAFLILAILLGVLIYFMFGPGQEPDHIGEKQTPSILLVFTALPSH